MTYPPPQPGPYGTQQPNPGPGQWGPQPGGWGGPPPGGYPGGGYPGYPPGPGGQPPRRKTGLIIGVVVAAVVLVGGGITAIVLTSGGHKVEAGPSIPTLSVSPLPGNPGPATSSRSSSSSRSSAASPAGSGSGGKPTPEALQTAVVAAYNDRDAQALPGLSCGQISDTDMQHLKDTMSQIPAQVVYSSAGAPQVTGSTGMLNLQAAGGDRSQAFQLPIAKSGSNWCVPTS